MVLSDARKLICRYFDYPVLKSLFDEHIRREQPVLMIGCGNSTLSEEMVKDNYKKIVNIDFSKVVIDSMLQKVQSKGLESQLEYLVLVFLLLN